MVVQVFGAQSLINAAVQIKDMYSDSRDDKVDMICPFVLEFGKIIQNFIEVGYQITFKNMI